MIQRLAAPAHGLVQRTGRGVLPARGMPGTAFELHQHRGNAAVGQHRLAHCRLGHQHRLVRNLPGQERSDAARVVGLLVGGKQEGGIAIAGIGRGHQRRSRALDVAYPQPDHTVIQPPHHVRVSRPLRRIGHGVQVDVEQVLRGAAHGVQADRTGTVVDDLDREARQLRAQVVEDATGGDRTRRIAGVEGHQLFQVRQGGVQEFGHGRGLWQRVKRNEQGERRECRQRQALVPRFWELLSCRQRLTWAYRVELMPNSLMKPSASSTPQSADCA